MHDLLPASAVSPLRQRLIDDMSLRRFSHETQRNYIRDVGCPPSAPLRQIEALHEQRMAGSS